MKFRSVLAILICFCTVLTFSACATGTIVKKDDNDEKKNEEKESKKDDEPENFSYVSENVFTEGDIQPAFDMMYGSMYVFGVSEYSNGSEKYLIDYTGKKLADVSSGEYEFCGLCAEYGNHMDAMDPETLTTIGANGGHGGSSWVFFDAYTEERYSMSYGYASLWEDQIDQAVYPLAQKREATAEESDFTGQDFTYEFAGEYALIIDNKIAQRGFENGINYDSNGIAALCKNGKWGYYNAEGKEILSCEYSPSAHVVTNYNTNTEAAIPYSSSCGYIALNKNGMWGYADTEGNLVTDFIFEEARPVYMGKAWVKQNGAWSVIAFEEYDTGLTEAEAKQRVIEYSNVNSYKLSLVKTDYKFYGANAYIYKADEGGYVTYYIVLYNSAVFVKYNNY